MKMDSKHMRLNSFDTIMAEREKVEEFCNHCTNDGQSVRLARRELFSEIENAVELRDEVKGLRLATLNDLYLVAPVDAAMAKEESGINPLAKDSEGFINRCARRISKNRVWVLVENGELIFKADVQAETSELIHLKGIYVNLEERETGLARRCFTQLCKFLLTRTSSITQVGTLPSFIYG